MGRQMGRQMTDRPDDITMLTALLMGTAFVAVNVAIAFAAADIAAGRPVSPELVRGIYVSAVTLGGSAFAWWLTRPVNGVR